MKNLKEIKGDASLRKFYRKKNKDYSSIIVFCKKDKFKNLLVYDAINKELNKNKILAPCLYNEKYNQNYIEIQDFGNQTVFKILNVISAFKKDKLFSLIISKCFLNMLIFILVEGYLFSSNLWYIREMMPKSSIYFNTGLEYKLF